MSNQKSPFQILLVAAILCVVCSLLVSTAAVILRPMQEENRKLDVQKKLLLVAGLLDNPKATAEEVREAFARVEVKIFDLQTGEIANNLDAETFDQRKAAKDPKLGKTINPKDDLAKIRTRSRYSRVYLIKDENKVESIVLSIHGKGLWSTLYGFIALAPDMNTIKGLGYYEHGETPGLGGEVDNPKWRASWKGRKLFAGDPVDGIAKGETPLGGKVDALAGATITTNGVRDMIKYWMGKDGYANIFPQLVKGIGK